jgi:pimeloyl-ACP methyl ester carboxylesterase
LESIGAVDLEVLRRGNGRSVLLLHGFQTFDPRATLLPRLEPAGEIIAPSHPGFGRSTRPPHFDTIYDLVHFYLDFLDTLSDKVILVGFSFGAWLAAEIAVKCVHRLDKLVLVDAVGIKVSDRETPDILDVFNTAPDEVLRRCWHDAQRGRPAFDAMSDDEIIVYARNREALCLYAWQPYMHNPALKHWLHRIQVPTLVLWGEGDKVVSAEYGRTFSSLIPGARFELIAAAGHHPELEQPEAVANAILRFVGV